MPVGAVPTDPDGRRQAVHVPVAAVWAPDGDQHRAGIVPVREAVEHHRGGEWELPAWGSPFGVGECTVEVETAGSRGLP